VTKKNLLKPDHHHKSLLDDLLYSFLGIPYNSIPLNYSVAWPWQGYNASHYRMVGGSGLFNTY
jgi:hypothetical protein